MTRFFHFSIFSFSGFNDFVLVVLENRIFSSQDSIVFDVVFIKFSCVTYLSFVWAKKHFLFFLFHESTQCNHQSMQWMGRTMKASNMFYPLSRDHCCRDNGRKQRCSWCCKILTHDSKRPPWNSRHRSSCWEEERRE